MGRRGAWLAVAILAVALPALPGCTVCDPHAGPPPVPATLDLPVCCRNRVYLFLVGDRHPAHHDLEKLRDKLIAAGFIKVYCGKRGHLGYFTRQLLKVHHCYPEARFVVIGQGGAAQTAHTLADRAGQAGAPVDLLVYLDADDCDGAGAAQHVIAIHGDKGPALAEGVQSYCVGETGWKGAAAHPQALQVLLDHLQPIAGQVPIREYEPSPAPGRLPAPQPVGPNNRLLPPPSPANLPERDDWDFLQPDGSDVGSPRLLPTTVAPGTGR
jgi:hypothetical protein